MKHRITGYFEADGSYNERGHPKQTGPDPKAKEWYQSLSPQHQEVIAWWNGEFGRGLAQFRMHDLQAFARKHGWINLKSPELHELAHSMFDEFKTFCRERNSL